MRILFCSVLFLSSVAATPGARAASYEFTWKGAQGYWLEGAFSIPDAQSERDYVSAKHVSCFRIKGYQGKTELGGWSLGDLTSKTHWSLHFEPSTSKFRIGGNSSDEHGQEWNMNGWGTGCGPNGFGFNSGNAAQDICVDNKLITASQVPARTPLKAIRNDKVRFSADDCNLDYIS